MAEDAGLGAHFCTRGSVFRDLGALLCNSNAAGARSFLAKTHGSEAELWKNDKSINILYDIFDKRD
jgi:hypothetical protein